MANELMLIIEDNEKNRKLARDVLQVKGYRTIETETAEEGIGSPVEWQSMANYRFQRDVATVNLSENFKPVRFQGRS